MKTYLRRFSHPESRLEETSLPEPTTFSKGMLCKIKKYNFTKVYLNLIDQSYDAMIEIAKEYEKTPSLSVS